MQIYLLRHGIAERTAASGNDADRALTGDGRKKLRAVLRLARAAGLTPSLILTSPYRRAVETAELAAEVLGCQGKVEHAAALAPAHRASDVWDEIRAHGDEESLLVSGHEPLCSETAAYLLAAGELAVDFKKGAIMAIEVEPLGARPKGVLKWMITPKLAVETG